MNKSNLQNKIVKYFILAQYSAAVITLLISLCLVFAFLFSLADVKALGILISLAMAVAAFLTGKVLEKRPRFM